ncbi:MAG: hypothetical protein RSA84_23150 [Acinetobacter sp.]
MAEIRNISHELSEEIIALEQKGFELLRLPRDSAPSDVVAAITELARNYIAEGTTLPEDEIYALGAVLGCQYVRGQDWHWGDVIWDYDEEGAAVGVLNHDNSLFINPIGWVAKVMKSKSGVGFMLNYNMVREHQVPVSEPDSAMGLY